MVAWPSFSGRLLWVQRGGPNRTWTVASHDSICMETQRKWLNTTRCKIEDLLAGLRVTSVIPAADMWRVSIIAVAPVVRCAPFHDQHKLIFRSNAHCQTVFN